MVSESAVSNKITFAYTLILNVLALAVWSVLFLWPDTQNGSGSQSLRFTVDSGGSPNWKVNSMISTNSESNKSLKREFGSI